MRDHPPDSLMTRLIELQICTAADMRRAQSRVRWMTRDLPAFDSVWVDALVQLGVLTPFQARRLEVALPDSLIAGDFVLRDGLGAGDASHTFLAVRRDRRGRVVLKHLSLLADQQSAVEARLEQLLERGRALRSAHLAFPTKLIRGGMSYFLVSEEVPGRDLRELLIRRGRFPARIVSLIVDLTLSGLSALHAAGLAHGDLRLTKLRLTDRGSLVLVDGGLKPALTPELLVHAVNSPEEADVVAPERIGTNQPATAASDLYSVGCIAWQLLTGRPPHPQIDPLTKLAAHQTQRIENVSDLAPDTPPQLAEVIYWLTSPNPQDRPHSAEEVRRKLGVRGSSCKGALARFRRQFEATVPHLTTRSATRKSHWQAVSAAVLVLGVAVVALSDRGLRTELLDTAQQTWSQRVSTEKAHPDTTRSRPMKRTEFPPPDARGVITLTDPGPYEVSNLKAVGPLTVQAADGVRPVIRIDGKEPIQIAAQSVTLKHLDFVWSGTSPPREHLSMIALKTQRFQVVGCRFIGPTAGDNPSAALTETPSPPDDHSGFSVGNHFVSISSISWQPLDRRDPQAGLLLIQDSSIRGEMHGLRCLSAPQQVTWRNVLKTHAGSALVIEQAQSPRELKLVLDHVTLRESGPLLTCSGPLTERVSAAGIDIQAAESVFDVAPSQPLVELRGPKVREDWPQAIRFLGDGVVLPPAITLLAAGDLQAGTPSPLVSDELQFEGLFLDDYEFSGPPTADPADSVLMKTQAPRRQAEMMPGADASRLPMDN